MSHLRYITKIHIYYRSSTLRQVGIYNERLMRHSPLRFTFQVVNEIDISELFVKRLLFCFVVVVLVYYFYFCLFVFVGFFVGFFFV